jgi:hypothetical protein
LTWPALDEVWLEQPVSTRPATTIRAARLTTVTLPSTENESHYRHGRVGG